MGKTPANKRLVIVAYPPVSEWPELAKLEEMGNEVRRADDGPPVDLILGGMCWRLTEELRKYLPIAIKNARREKKGK